MENATGWRFFMKISRQKPSIFGILFKMKPHVSLAKWSAACTCRDLLKQTTAVSNVITLHVSANLLHPRYHFYMNLCRLIIKTEIGRCNWFLVRLFGHPGD